MRSKQMKNKKLSRQQAIKELRKIGQEYLEMAIEADIDNLYDLSRNKRTIAHKKKKRGSNAEN